MISVEHILSRRLTAFNAVKGKAYPRYEFITNRQLSVGELPIRQQEGIKFLPFCSRGEASEPTNSLQKLLDQSLSSFFVSVVFFQASVWALMNTHCLEFPGLLHHGQF